MTPDLSGRRIILGISGGIAAYKAVEVCRRLVDSGAHVVPVMTRDASRFVGTATVSALASEPVHGSLWRDRDPVPHITLARAADAILVAPATANLLGRYAAGISDDLLTATLLATTAPVLVCPAMHTEMWEHPAVQDNVARLRERGVQVVGPAVGRLAGGDEGPGRLVDPEDIVAAVTSLLAPKVLSGRRVVVTAGGTREPLDPVRYLGNRSSGKQGYALAVEAAARGASVTLVATVVRHAPPGVEVVLVETAEEMERAVLSRSSDTDVVLMAAAVADFRAKGTTADKLAKAEGVPDVVLEPTPDILAELGRRKLRGQVLVGFAAETSDLQARARAKLEAKGLDLVVANDVTASGAGFDADTNQVVLLEADGTVHDLPLMSKRDVAKAVLDVVSARLVAAKTGQ